MNYVCYLLLNQSYCSFTITALSLYVVNNTIYMFGARYISFTRITIEVLISLIYCFILDLRFMERDYNQEVVQFIQLSFGVLLISIIICEQMYYIMCVYFYAEDTEKKIISMKVFQVLGFIIIIMLTYDLSLNSFNYHSCIKALQYSVPAGYFLIEPLIFFDDQYLDDKENNVISYTVDVV